MTWSPSTMPPHEQKALAAGDSGLQHWKNKDIHINSFWWKWFGGNDKSNHIAKALYETHVLEIQVTEAHLIQVAENVLSIVVEKQSAMQSMAELRIWTEPERNFFPGRQHLPVALKQQNRSTSPITKMQGAIFSQVQRHLNLKLHHCHVWRSSTALQLQPKCQNKPTHSVMSTTNTIHQHHHQNDSSVLLTTMRALSGDDHYWIAILCASQPSRLSDLHPIQSFLSTLDMNRTVKHSLASWMLWAARNKARTNQFPGSGDQSPGK